jgi:hypothetical protein
MEYFLTGWEKVATQPAKDRGIVFAGRNINYIPVGFLYSYNSDV